MGNAMLDRINIYELDSSIQNNLEKIKSSKEMSDYNKAKILAFYKSALANGRSET